MHVDYNETEGTYFYQYPKDNSPSFAQNNLNFPVAKRKQILLEVGQALHDLHSKNRIHVGMESESRMPIEFHSFSVLDVRSDNFFIERDAGTEMPNSDSEGSLD